MAPHTARLDHIALRCSDLARSRHFYGEVLGFPIVAETATAFVVQAGASLIGSLAPDPTRPGGDAFDPRRVGLDHVALRCDDEAELQRVADALTTAGVEHTGVKVNPNRIAWQLAMRH